jgi:hypothetical protein
MLVIDLSSGDPILVSLRFYVLHTETPLVRLLRASGVCFLIVTIKPLKRAFGAIAQKSDWRR